MLSRDPNAHGYQDIDDMINPEGEPTLFHFVSHLPTIAWRAATKVCQISFLLHFDHFDSSLLKRNVHWLRRHTLEREVFFMAETN